MYRIFTSGSTIAWLIFTQFFWTAAVVLGILLAIRVYCYRHMLLQLVTKLVFEEYGGLLPGLRDSHTRCMSCQTDNVDYQSESDKLIKQYSKELKQAQRYILQMKRKFTQRVSALKEMSKQRSKFLSKMQLKFPNIEREKELLLAERDAIEKQYQEERRRNRELISRFQRLHQQFGRVGQAAFSQHPREPNVIL
ncbi:uncharacterized protein LOC121380356 isoform X2 [Gigantopelta aegis]|nr:uncharacterized protein LOC121380356 isoform X2 [Gigantopelta aegis]